MKSSTASAFCRWPTTKLSLLALVVLALSGCGDPGCSSYDEYTTGCPPTAKIKSFDVYGNDTPVNGREQIVAGINSGIFKIGLNIEPAYSDDAKIFISDQETVDSTNFEQEIAHLKCKYPPLCNYSMTINCNFSITNYVSCELLSRVDRFTQANFQEVDISPMLNGNQTDLFIVLDVRASGLEPAQRVIPVTFRYN